MQFKFSTILFSFFLLITQSPLLSASEDAKNQRSQEEKAVLYQAIRLVLKVPKMEYVLSPLDKAWEDLEVSELAQFLDRTKLGAAAVEFADLIQPISDLRRLETRRNIVQKLVNDQVLFKALDPLLAMFAYNYEDSILDLAFAHDRPKDLSMIPLVVNLGWSSLVLYLTIPYSVNLFQRNIGLIRGGQRPFAVAFNTFFSLMGNSWGFYQIGEKAYTQIKDYSESASKAYDFVSKFSDILVLINKITDEIESSTILKKAFPVFSSFRKLSEEDEELQDALSRIDHLSYFNSLEAYRSLNRVGREFGEVLRGIARLDAYFSVARLYKEFEGEGKSLVFAQYTSPSFQPHFSFDGLYIPYFEDSVTNDFWVYSHMILTGPHKAGKTASMKAIAYAHILGQSLTIVPATRAKFAPVSMIKTYFQPKQSAVKGSSGNSAESVELRRLEKFAEVLSKQEGKLGLFLVDEPYVNTRAIIGESRVTKFMESLMHSRGLRVLLSTHLEKPSLLQAKYPVFVTNYMPVIEGEGPEFKTTYKIKEGRADWWFTNQTRIDLYLDWLDSQTPIEE